MLATFRPRSSFRKHTGGTALGRFFHLYSVPKEKPPLRAVVLLFLGFLENLVLSSRFVELLEFNLSLYFLLVFARIEYVPRSALELDEMVL